MVSMEELLALFDVETDQQWSDALFSIAAKCGFQYTLFGLVTDKAMPLETAFLKTNYPAEWRALYDGAQMHFTDPRFSHCLSSTLPIAWMPSAARGAQCRHGMRSGISLPMHGPGGEFGMLSLVGGADDSARRPGLGTLATLALVRDHALESALKFLKARPGAEPAVSLTARELECLKWAMQGKSSWEISQILRRSEATINFHVSNAKKKFRVPTRQQAVIKAIRLGLLVAG